MFSWSINPFDCSVGLSLYASSQFVSTGSSHSESKSYPDNISVTCALSIHGKYFTFVLATAASLHCTIDADFSWPPLLKIRSRVFDVLYHIHCVCSMTCCHENKSLRHALILLTQ